MRSRDRGFLRGQIYLSVNKLEFRTFDDGKRPTNSSFERELIKKSSDNFVFLRILFTKENYIIFLNTPVLGTHTVVTGLFAFKSEKIIKYIRV